MTPADLPDALPPGAAVTVDEATRLAAWCGHLPAGAGDDDEDEEDERPSATVARAGRMLADLATRGLLTEPEPGRYQRDEEAIRARTYRGRVLVDEPDPERARPRRRTVAPPGPPVKAPPARGSRDVFEATGFYPARVVDPARRED